MLVNLALVRVLGIDRMAGDPFVAATAGKALFGERGDLVIRSLVLLSILSGINACLLMAPRVVLAMGRDRLLPAGFETVNPGGTPTVGHWASVGVAVGFIVSGTFNTVLALCAFFFVASYTLSFLSVFVLRRKEPDTPRPYRVPGFPFTTGLALLGSLAFLVGSVVTDWGNSWKSLLLLALSYPVYRLIIAARDRSGRELAMRFTRAIVRPPAATFAAGITSSRLGPPDLALALEQHDAYCRTLERLGLSLVRLAPDPDFPDSTFVEDAAIVTTRGAILTRPGAASRAGEVAALGAVLREWFPELAEITAPGTVDGGDVCEAGQHFFIGLSDAHQSRGRGPAGRVAGAAWLHLQRDRHPGDARPAASEDRTLLAGWATVARRRRDRRTRSAERVGDRAGAGRGGLRRQLHQGQRCAAGRPGFSRRPARYSASWAMTSSRSPCRNTGRWTAG